jgi:transposase
MQAYSLDLRSRVLEAVDAGQRRDEIAGRFTVSLSWIRRLLQRRRETGSIEAKPHHRCGPKPALEEADLQRLRELVVQQRDATLTELRDRLGEPVSIMTICRALQRLELPLKKSPNEPKSSPGRTSPSSGANTRRPCRIWMRGG